jgi:hypothetical protein
MIEFLFHARSLEIVSIEFPRGSSSRLVQIHDCNSLGQRRNIRSGRMSAAIQTIGAPQSCPRRTALVWPSASNEISNQ